MQLICFISRYFFTKGLPFDVKIPDFIPLDIKDMTDEELNVELEKGYRSAEEGNTKSAKNVFADIRKEYNL